MRNSGGIPPVRSWERPHPAPWNAYVPPSSPYPTSEATAKLLKYYLDKAPLPYEETLLQLNLPCMSGADIENIVNQAVFEAIWNDDIKLLKKHFNFELERRF